MVVGDILEATVGLNDRLTRPERKKASERDRQAPRDSSNTCLRIFNRTGFATSQKQNHRALTGARLARSINPHLRPILKGPPSLPTSETYHGGVPR